jgi:hypothetical protein
MLALETGRRGINMVVKIFTDPVALATMGAGEGVAADIIAAAFTAQGIETAAKVAQDPNAKAEDVAEALLGVAVMAVPAAARVVMPKWREAVSSAALKARDLAAAAEAKRAAARTITPDPTDIAVTPRVPAIAAENPIGAPTQGPRLAQEPPTRAGLFARALRRSDRLPRDPSPVVPAVAPAPTAGSRR